MCLNETYNKVRTDKNVSSLFLIQNDLKKVDALSLLLFKFALSCAVRTFEENRKDRTDRNALALALC
jgi:hypothetical protein